jgi:predicted enzyme related to lactoylglutathione lyase
MSNSVVHWEVGSTDLQQDCTFFADLFGWEITPAGPEYALVAGAEPGIGGGFLQVREGMPPYLTFYVQVDQLEATLARALELGGTQVVAPTAIPGVGRFALIQDPGDHIVGLMEEAPDRSPSQ